MTICGEYSELGQQIREVCSPGHALFNIGLVASGALILLAIAAGPGIFRKVTTLVVAVSTASFAIFTAALEGYEVPWIGLGGIERLSFDSLTIWTALTVVALLNAHRSHRPTKELQ